MLKLIYIGNNIFLIYIYIFKIKMWICIKINNIFIKEKRIITKCNIIVCDKKTKRITIIFIIKIIVYCVKNIKKL